MRIWPFRRREQTRSAQTWDVWKNLPFFGFGPTAAGVTVTSESPLTHETVLSCYNVIAEGCAMLPAHLYRERGATRRHASDHPLYDLLTVGPCLVFPRRSGPAVLRAAGSKGRRAMGRKRMHTPEG